MTYGPVTQQAEAERLEHTLEEIEALPVLWNQRELARYQDRKAWERELQQIAARNLRGEVLADMESGE